MVLLGYLGSSFNHWISVGIMNITQFKIFKERMKDSESDGDYEAVNRYGFLGAYQFGKPRLWDMGISINGWKPKRGQQKDFISKEFFLNSKTLQDGVFVLHVFDAIGWIERKKYKKDGYTLSALVAVFHLLGYGGVTDFVNGTNKYIKQDGNGTSALDYADKFNNIF